MDSTSNIFGIKNKIFLQGEFVGKYQANQFAILSNCNLSNINILEGTLNDKGFINKSQPCYCASYVLKGLNLVTFRV